MRAVMGHGGMSKRQLVLPPTNDRVDNSLPQFPRPPSDRPSLPAVAQFGDHDRRRHPLFPPPHRGHLRPGHRPPASSAVDNPLFPLMSAGDDGSVGGRALLRDFITFLDLKGAYFSRITLLLLFGFTSQFKTACKDDSTLNISLWRFATK